MLRRLLSICTQIKAEVISGSIENFDPSCGSCPLVAEQKVRCPWYCMGCRLIFCLDLFDFVYWVWCFGFVSGILEKVGEVVVK